MPPSWQRLRARCSSQIGTNCTANECVATVRALRAIVALSDALRKFEDQINALDCLYLSASRLRRARLRETVLRGIGLRIHCQRGGERPLRGRGVGALKLEHAEVHVGRVIVRIRTQ